MTIEAVIALEISLLQPAVRRSTRDLDRLLASNFREIGVSGKMWNRQDMIDMLVSSNDGPISATQFEGQFIDAATVLLTYATARALRSSLWTWQDDRWQLVFHQGTPITQ